MNVTEVTVEFKKTVSDGNYGNETFSVSYTAAIDEGEDANFAIEALTEQAREHATRRLKESQNEGIRYAMETPEEREARYAKEREEREAERRRREAARLATAVEAVPAHNVDLDDTPF
ncbi:MAG TPA: hypothetical protein VGW38_10565 [Chloroflexota bacterium]|nr:hypothetical protein [Chloroflexota bacterium]